MSMFEANCQFLAENLPNGKTLVRSLRNIPSSSYQFTGMDDANNLNLIRDGKLVYTDGAVEFAKSEATAYLNNPKRYYIMKPSPEIDKGNIGSRFRSAFYPFVEKCRLHEEPTTDAGYAVIQGLGLGIHLNLLRQYLPVDHYILAETDLIQFRASCDVFPWFQFIKELEQQGKKVTLLVFDNAEIIGTAMMTNMRDEFHVFLDGSYIYRHGVDVDGSMERAAVQFNNSLVTLEYSLGFFEDECLMFKNTMKNLAQTDFHLLPKSAKERLGISAMVIGSGPSMDESIPAIKKNAENALLISGGTSFSILSEHGIAPDFHTQYENDTLNYDVTRKVSETYGYKDTILISPMTIDPRIVPFFKKVIFYFRDALSPTSLLANDEQVVTNSGPTVTNTGCRAALAMGADAMVLFGVDLGGPTEDDHHAEDSIYFKLGDTVGEESGMKFEDIPHTDPQCFPVEGNRQEVVYTSRIFMQAKLYYESLFLDHADTPVYNCSNGVKIQGVTDVLPEQLLVKAPKVDKSRLKANLLNSMQSYGAGEFVKDSKLVEFLARYNEIIDALESVCREVQTTQTMQSLTRQMIPITLTGQISVAPTTDNACKTVILGSLIQMLQSGLYLYRRLEEGQEYDFMLAFRQAILPFIDEFREKMTEVVEEARSDLQKG